MICSRPPPPTPFFKNYGEVQLPLPGIEKGDCPSSNIRILLSDKYNTKNNTINTKNRGYMGRNLANKADIGEIYHTDNKKVGGISETALHKEN